MTINLRILLCLFAFSLVAACSDSPEPEPVTGPQALSQEQRFADMALQCLHQEYPNHILHHVSGPDEMGEPHELYPSFYGCFDWHSSVHGHWLLTRLLRLNSPGLDRERITAALKQSFAAENIAGEVAYFSGPDRRSFERPYGRAWFLQLIAELGEWDDASAQVWRETLRPLEALIVEQMMAYLPNLNYAVRSGTHGQTAFSFGLMLDYARSEKMREFEILLEKKIRQFHLTDRNCPLDYEPSGADFLSPCLMEADLVRRILPPAEFATWLGEFLPQIPGDGRGDWLDVGVVLDATDGHLVHLDGVNLSRAWALHNIAASLPKGDARIAALSASADVHAEAGLAAVTGEHYAGGHWLASFATYLVTNRGG